MDVKREPLDIGKLMKQLNLLMRKEAIASLLAGNDTQCFTTQQYREAFCRRQMKNARDEEIKVMPAFYDRVIDPDWARMHLETLPKLVKEVKPDVWAAVEKQS